MLSTPSVRAQKDQQTLRFVAEADLQIFDPVWTTAYITRNHGYLVYDTLFGTDENFQVKPQMVERTTVSPGAARTRTPMLATFGCCARAASGQAATAPPRSAMNSRRFAVSMRFPPVAPLLSFRMKG
jgi:hypothetical protein